MKPIPQKVRSLRRGRVLACLTAGLLAAAGVTDALAQKKGTVRRARNSKEELIERAKQLKDELPQLKDAARSEDDKTRDDVRRQALQILDDAVSGDMREELDAEARRLSDGEQSSAAGKLETARRLADKVRAEAPEDARKLLDQVPAGTLKPEDTPADDGDTDRPDRFDGMVVKATDGRTIKVPGIQVAGQFDGKVVPVEGNGPAPGPKPAPKVRKLTKAEKAAQSGVVDIECAGSAVFSANGENPEAGGTGPRVIIFNDKVRITSSDTIILCDKLIVYMLPEKDAEGKEKETDAGGLGGGSIDRAVASGAEVVVRQQKPDGSVRLAKARKATYYNNGDVVLEDFPQVQDGLDFTIATERSTVITLPGDKSKKAIAKGPNKTRIMVPSEGDEGPVFKGLN